MKQWSATLVLVGLLSASLGAQAPQETEYRSVKLTTVGVLSVIVGLGLVIPHGENYQVYGETYCVDTRSVDVGSCQPSARKIGFYLIGGGILATWIGSRPVTVRPTRTGIGATATVAWGGSKRK